jgi:pyruvate/2-oxoglutarate dehydrogenase complex dihydrolipoamide dehydrogenase (E3) component
MDIMRKVRELVEQAHQAKAVSSLQDVGIEYLQGTARFIDNSVLDVDGNFIRADRIVIATGSSPVVPEIPGLDTVSYLTNENIFQLENLPQSLIVLGAGAIGVELCQAMQRLGVKVKLVDSAKTILPREEPEFSEAVQKILWIEGVEIHTSSSAQHVRQDGAEIVLTVQKNGEAEYIRGHALLLALGRRPNTHAMNLADVGIEFDAKGIKVNSYYETTTTGIYAVGDVVGPYLFSHTGGYQARELVRNLFSNNTPKPISKESVAWCTFVEPELAHSGLSEAEARILHGDHVRVFSAQYSDLDRAVVDQKTFGMAKVVCDKHGHILGASILGERACELLCELQVMKQHGIPLQSLQEAIHPYPGYSEILLGLSLDAYAYFKETAVGN